MSKNALLEKYIEYTEILKEKLDGYFTDQKEFLKCKAGCDLCCKNSYYPVSQLEYEYIKIGFEKNYSKEEREKINQTAVDIIKNRREFLKTNPNIMEFSYKCPFLVDGACGNYEYRALLCRSHGLIYKDPDKTNKNNAPCCMKLGLNYSDVHNSEENKFLSDEKIKELGIESTPKAYNLSYSALMEDSGISDFGDVRMLFEWILMDIPNYEELIKE